MITDLQIVLLIVAGIIGTLGSIALGWSESTDPFDLKKFVSSLIRGIIAAVIFIVGTYASALDVVVWDYVVVALFAAGFEVYAKRSQNIVIREQAE